MVTLSEEVSQPNDVSRLVEGDEKLGRLGVL